MHGISDNYDGGLSIPKVYLACLYFSFTSLSTVGFGNAAPQLHYERVYSICLMVVGGKSLSCPVRVSGASVICIGPEFSDSEHDF